MRKEPIIILCGGKGTRLGELTRNCPKPMLNINGKPFLHYLVQYLIGEGFRDFIFSTGFKAEVIDAYPWEDRFSQFECSFRSVRDTKCVGPLSAIADIFDFLELDNAYTCNGDTYPIWPHAIGIEYGESVHVFNAENIDTGFAYYKSSNFRASDAAFIDIGTPEGLQRFQKHIAD